MPTVQNKLLRIGIFNLMPDRLRTEADLLRVLPADAEITWLRFETHMPTGRYADYSLRTYVPFGQVTEGSFDALIVTGAPIEMLEFEDVSYFEEFKRLRLWADTHARSALYICWGAFAAAYERYGVEKKKLPAKISGAFSHNVSPDPVTSSMPGQIVVPHSRNTFVDTEQIRAAGVLSILVESDEAGVHLVREKRPDGGSNYLQFGHWEYAPDTLDMEFRRDSARGLDPAVPANYYYDDNPDQPYRSEWVGPGKIFFANWLDALR